MYGGRFSSSRWWSSPWHCRVPGRRSRRRPTARVYSWFGAATLTRRREAVGRRATFSSDPFLIDCPLACIRPFESGSEVKLIGAHHPGAHVRGAGKAPAPDRGTRAPSTVVRAAVDVTAVLDGQFVPPTPPPSATPPASGSPPASPSEVNPALSVVDAPGECPSCFTTVLSGTGFHPNSPISITFVFSSPATSDQVFQDVETSDASGSWTQGFFEPCDLRRRARMSAPVEADVIATDAEGASATGHSSGVCPEQPAPPSS